MKQAALKGRVTPVRPHSSTRVPASSPVHRTQPEGPASRKVSFRALCVWVSVSHVCVVSTRSYTPHQSVHVKRYLRVASHESRAASLDASFIANMQPHLFCSLTRDVAVCPPVTTCSARPHSTHPHQRVRPDARSPKMNAGAPAIRRTGDVRRSSGGGGGSGGVVTQPSTRQCVPGVSATVPRNRVRTAGTDELVPAAPSARRRMSETSGVGESWDGGLGSGLRDGGADGGLLGSAAVSEEDDASWRTTGSSYLGQNVAIELGGAIRQGMV